MMTAAEKTETYSDSRLIEESLRSSLLSFRQMPGAGRLDVKAQDFIHSSMTARSCLRQLRRNGVEVVLTLSGRLSGTFVLVLSDAAARQLVTALVGETPHAASFNDMARSALKEVGNVIASAFLGALERLSGSGGMPGLPDLRLEAGNHESSGDGTGSVLYGLPMNFVGGKEESGIPDAGMFITLNINSACLSYHSD